MKSRSQTTHGRLTRALVAAVCLLVRQASAAEPIAVVPHAAIVPGAVSSTSNLETMPILPYEKIPGPPPAGPANYALRPLTALTIQAKPPQDGLPVPPNNAATVRHVDAKFAPYSDYRPWMTYEYSWVASGLAHKPLYFEDVNLERYGNSICPTLQPVFSATRFVTTIPLLPYLMTVDKPCECVYTLGYCRPGNKTANLFYYPPAQLKAAAVEAAAVTGFVFFIP
jgi:hypothetical protein